MQEIDPDADFSGATAEPIFSGGLQDLTGPQHPHNPARG
jgi:hypothetical protein